MLKSFLRRVSSALAITAMTATFAQAQIVDLAPVSGKGLFYDTQTGLTWMDFSTFYGQDYNTQLGNLLPGFRTATFAEVRTLTLGSMNNLPGQFSTYFSIVGGANTQNREIIWGNNADGAVVNWYYAYQNDGGWSNYDLGSFYSGAAADLGLWAVSETSVTPEPASLALVATGLLGVAGAVRRRKA